jgi:glutathione peroxidase-family protein
MIIKFPAKQWNGQNAISFHEIIPLTNHTYHTSIKSVYSNEMITSKL